VSAARIGFEPYRLGDHPVVPVDKKLLDHPARWKEGATEPVGVRNLAHSR
jgi:hypothetical protein